MATYRSLSNGLLIEILTTIALTLLSTAPIITNQGRSEFTPNRERRRMKKAEERKENETNSLRLWVDHMADRLKGRNLYILVGHAGAGGGGRADLPLLSRSAFKPHILSVS